MGSLCRSSSSVSEDHPLAPAIEATTQCTTWFCSNSKFDLIAISEKKFRSTFQIKQKSISFSLCHHRCVIFFLSAFPNIVMACICAYLHQILTASIALYFLRQYEIHNEPPKIHQCFCCCYGRPWPTLGPLSSGQGKLMQFVDPDRIEQSDRVQAASFAPVNVSVIMPFHISHSNDLFTHVKGVPFSRYSFGLCSSSFIDFPLCGAYAHTT